MRVSSREFLLELYVSREAEAVVRGTSERARSAADELTRAGTPVRCVCSIFVPEDETCFLLYEADSIGVVQEAASRAGLSFERIAGAKYVSMSHFVYAAPRR
jgi:predicted methyltransferase MtxX (methanogen marker protein 4)